MDLVHEYRKYENTIREYSDIINDKADAHLLSEAKAEQLINKLNQWFDHNTRRLEEAAKAHDIGQPFFLHR